MNRASLVASLAALAFSATAAAADNTSLDQMKAAAHKLKLSNASAGSSRAAVSRSGSLVYNVTINRKLGAPVAPFYCKAYAYHEGACVASDATGCVYYQEYELSREVLATGTGTTYTCSIRLNYNFPKGDSADYLWPAVEVYHSNSTTSYPSASGTSWRGLAPVILPSAAVTTFSVLIDE